MSAVLERRPGSPATGRRNRAVGRAPLLGVFVIALAARLGLVLTSPGGLTGNLGDDAAAYYAGSDALLHGRVPYGDFTLLHPPLLLIVLAPFAAIGLMLGDHVGFVLADLANQATGAVCAVLVVLVCRRYGLTRPACYAAGVFYAVWFGAALTDMLIRLETLATLLMLVGLFVLAGDRRGRHAIAGAAFGLAAATKIWGIEPAAVLAIGVLISAGPRRALAFSGAASAASLVVLGPFLALAPGPTWRMIFTDQLGRPRSHRARLPQLTGVDVFAGKQGGPWVQVSSWAAAAVVLAVLILALRVAAARPAAALVVVGVVVLFASPYFFDHYLGLVAAPLAICVGAAAQVACSSRMRRWRSGALGLVSVTVVGASVVTVFVMTRADGSGPRAFPTAQVARAIDGTRCPMPDGPVALILTDNLSRTLTQGCPNWVDVTGRVYDVDAAPEGPAYPRPLNARWQRDLTRYLLSGQVVITFRPGAAPGPGLQRILDRLPVLVRRDGVVVRCSTVDGCPMGSR